MLTIKTPMFFKRYYCKYKNYFLEREIKNYNNLKNCLNCEVLLVAIKILKGNYNC